LIELKNFARYSLTILGVSWSVFGIVLLDYQMVNFIF